MATANIVFRNAFRTPLCNIGRMNKPAALTYTFPKSYSICTKCLARNTHTLSLAHSNKLFGNQLKTFTVGASYYIRFVNTQNTHQQRQAYNLIYYIAGTLITMFGVAYAGVPLYKKFCQANGLGGLAEASGHDRAKIKTMKAVRDRPIRVEFIADTASTLKWNFRPTQKYVEVVPGETALAFFKAKNSTETPVIGVATYNVLPYKAALYFNKIQCFCFEEQRLNPHEEVDMPVFFYIDPEYDLDIDLLNNDDIVLSYTFFEAKPGIEIPMPEWMKQMNQPKTPAIVASA